MILTDSLVTRLEYVPDSQKSSAKADFSVQPNDARSEQLTWKLAEPLKVGEGATIEFKCEFDSDKHLTLRRLLNKMRVERQRG